MKLKLKEEEELQNGPDENIPEISSFFKEHIDKYGEFKFSKDDARYYKSGRSNDRILFPAISYVLKFKDEKSKKNKKLTADLNYSGKGIWRVDLDLVSQDEKYWYWYAYLSFKTYKSAIMAMKKILNNSKIEILGLRGQVFSI